MVFLSLHAARTNVARVDSSGTFFFDTIVQADYHCHKRRAVVFTLTCSSRANMNNSFVLVAAATTAAK